MFRAVARAASARAVASLAVAPARAAAAPWAASGLSAARRVRFLATEADTEASQAMNKLLSDALEADYVMVRDVSGESVANLGQLARLGCLFRRRLWLTRGAPARLRHRRRLRLDVPGACGL